MDGLRLRMGGGSLPVILQTEAAECGLACLAMVAAYHGHRIDMNTLRRRHPISLQGVTLRGLIEVAKALDLACRPVRYEVEHIRHLALPAVVHWDMNHFVVLKSVSARRIVVHDPAYGERRLTYSEASHHLTGVALEIVPAEGFRKRDERARLPLSTFWQHSTGMRRSLIEVIVLSLVLEALVLAGPFYMQVTVDEVIARGDRDLMAALAIGFALLTALRVAVNALRARIILILQNILHYQIGARLFRHLLRLPIAYFEKRHVGDVISRFGSIDPIRNLLAQGLIAALIDGVLALLTLAMILAYSPTLAVIVLVGLTLCIGLRLSLFARFRRLNEEAIAVGAQEDTTFIETLRAVQSVKLNNREAEREGQWLNRFAETVNANLALGRAKIGFLTIDQALTGAEYVVTVYVAAVLTLDGVLTVGMIFAFMSYREQFVEKSLLLLQTALDLSLVRLHLERLSDIAVTPQEPGHDRPLARLAPLRGEIVLERVCFRYAEGERNILQDVSLTIPAGRFTAITGPSGGGKTTLVKIMLGLLEPTSGQVLIDGMPLQTYGIRNYREQVAAVMQEDHLLSGSIADNIAFLDTVLDERRMVESAVRAGVHDEILAMPMGYDSLIGDMGSSLSGGQKQRILLARALYRQPRLLFLDEGTAHLDLRNERLVNESLRALAMTRVSVAHRPEISCGADLLIHVEGRCQVIEGAAVTEALARIGVPTEAQ
ncbi:peptidase domain-containing ABC transporter [Methylorubrum podarium]|jgi:ATP-binding cassette, subfamily B, bacterial CvaB/MchF/RaxB|uniref:peptidase domain-containing ABC transporter n=1 Tax=Methylorubrum podarium TaxID=200476 RepID=UPI001EE29183|nr:peptidase domain-containing ABC transporter [Methylorubrum podarium]GJE72610.1 Toxin RTX-I translocation ATP-binding protein [Methylorubrum podarium]